MADPDVVINGQGYNFAVVKDLGSFTGRIDEDGLELVEVKPETWVAKVSVRKVEEKDS